MRSLFGDLTDGFKYPAFWAFSGWLDIAVKVRRSRLGVLWLIMPSVVYIWGIGFIYSHFMGMSLRKYAAHVGIGFVIFKLVQTVTAESTHVMFSARSFIMDGHLRLTDFVLRSTAKALFHFLVSLPIVILAICIYPDLHGIGVLEGLAALPVVLLNMIWVGVLFSLIGARYPDLSNFIGNIFMFMFLLTPIVWYADKLPADSMRGILSRLNPFFHLIEVVRAPMLGDHLSIYSWVYLGVMTVVGWVVTVIAYRRYAHFVPIWL